MCDEPLMLQGQCRLAIWDLHFSLFENNLKQTEDRDYVTHRSMDFGVTDFSFVVTGDPTHLGRK